VETTTRLHRLKFTVWALSCGRLGATQGSAAVTPGELLNTSGGIYKLLFTREERMAGCTNTNFDIALVGTGLVDGSAGAADVGFEIVGMDVGFHNGQKWAGKLAAVLFCANKNSITFERNPSP